MAMTPEGRVKAAVKRWLAARGIWYFMPVSNGLGRMGIPDFICCWGGRFLAIECKAPGQRRRTTPLQERTIMEIHQAGGAALVVDDVSQLDQWEKKHAQVDQGQA
jgi:hypothetical protein